MPSSIPHILFVALLCGIANTGIPGQEIEGDSSAPEEVYLRSHTVADPTKGVTYEVKLYYCDFYDRLRVTVSVEGRLLTGLFNRHYGLKPIPDSTAFMWPTPDGNYSGIILMLGQLHENGRVNHTGIHIGLSESPLDTDTIYNAVEEFVGEPRRMTFFRPPGLLRKTCAVRILGRGNSDFLVDEKGRITTLRGVEDLRQAYSNEGITAQSSDDYQRICVSLIETENRFLSRGEAILISSINDIPGYAEHPLALETAEAAIRPAWISKGSGDPLQYWNCYTYNKFHGVVAHYRFGFREGNVVLAEKTILGEGVGAARYLAAEVRGQPQSQRRRSHWPASPTLPVRYSVAIALLLLSAALYLRRRRRHRSTT